MFIFGMYVQKVNARLQLKVTAVAFHLTRDQNQSCFHRQEILTYPYLRYDVLIFIIEAVI